MSTPTSEGKNIAIIAYIFIGLIIAFVMNNDKKDPFASFHIRNMLGLVLFAIANSILSYLGIPFIPWIISILLFVLWIIGLIGAVQGERKELPIIGPMFQEWFKSV